MSTTTPEGRVKAQIKRYLTSLGAYYFMPIGGPYSVHGVPDFMGVLRGRGFGVEAKAPGKKGNTTPSQKLHLAQIALAGGVATVADCVDDVKKAFAAAGLV